MLHPNGKIRLQTPWTTPHIAMGSPTKSALVTFVGCHELVANTNLWRSLVAEFLGTFVLVLAGCGVCISFIHEMSIAMALGLIVLIVVMCIWHVSICIWGVSTCPVPHINPAVSIGMLMMGKISLVRYLLYVLCQCAGAIAGAALLKALTPGALQKSLGATLVPDGMSEVEAFGVEFLSTFVLVLTVVTVSDRNHPVLYAFAPGPIGLAVAVCSLFAIRFSGASLNPARSIGPAVIMNIWSGHWVYWVGPNLGGVVAAILCLCREYALKLVSEQEIKLKASEI